MPTENQPLIQNVPQSQQQDILYQPPAAQYYYPPSDAQAPPAPQEQQGYQQVETPQNAYQAQNEVYPQGVPIYQAPPLPPQTYTDPQIITADPSNQLQEPIIILLLNFIFAGLGTVLMGQVEKGLFYIVTHFIEIILSSVFSSFGLLPFLIIVFIRRIIIMVDGYICAEKLRREGYLYKGEFWSWWSMIGFPLFVKSVPAFVTGSSKDPRMQQQQQ